MEIHPQFISREGTDEYVLLPVEEFRAMEEALEDYRDLQNLRTAKSEERLASTVSLDDILEDLE